MALDCMTLPDSCGTVSDDDDDYDVISSMGVNDAIRIL